MRRTPGPQGRPINKHPLAGVLSLIISTGLILIPVLPVSAASLRAASLARVEATAAPAHNAAPASAPAPVAAAAVVPSLTATKTDSFPDPDGDGKAEPGQTITYTVTITNNGTDATNVVFNDNVDPNTTLVNGSVSTQPVAAADSYNVLGNVRIQPSAASGLLVNDCDPDNGPSCSSAGLTASGPATSAQGGNVAVNPDGSFSYNPPPGFEGADEFTYTVTDPSGKTDTAKANLTVGDVVWFVNNNAAPGGDGRLTSPFNALAPLGGADLDESGDVIFVYQGAAAYDGGITLEDGQRLVGQGTALDTALALFGITAPAHSDARPAATSAPTLANSGGNVVTLANGNTVLALNASATAPASAGIFGSGVGPTSISGVGVGASGGAHGVSLNALAGPLTMTNSSVTANTSGTAVFINGGAAPVNFNNTDVSQIGGRVVDIQSRAAGSAVTFDAASSVTGTNGTTDAVTLLSNAGAVTFGGPVQLNTSARGLVADSGAVNLTNGGNAVNSTGGAAVDLENLTANVAFATTFSTNSNTRGVRVVSVAGAVSFGNTAVNNSANTGVLLTDNSAALSFSDLDIAPAAGKLALHAVDNTGTISSTGGDITTSAAAAVTLDGPAGRTPVNITLTNVTTSGATDSISLVDVSGAKFQVTGTTQINTRTGTGVFVDNTTTANVQLGATNIPNPANAGGYGIRVEDSSSAVTVASADIDNANVTTAQTDPGNDGLPDTDGDGDAIFLANNAGSFALNGGTLSNCGNDCIDVRGSQNLSLAGVTINSPGIDASGGAGTGGHGIQAVNLAGANSLTSVNVKNFNNAARDGVRLINNAAAAMTMTVGQSLFADSTSGGSGIFIAGRDNANMALVVQNNSTFQNLSGAAVAHRAGDNVGSTATVNLTVQNSIFQNAPNGGQNTLHAQTAEGGKAIVLVNGSTFDNVARTVADTAGVIDVNGDATLAGNALSVNITNNTIRNIGTSAAGSCGALPCASRRGIDVFMDDNTDASGTIVIDGNILTNIQRAGIVLDTGSAFNGASYNAKITNNTIGTSAARVGVGTALSAGGESGVRIENRNNNSKNLILNFSGNTVRNGNGGAGSALNTPGVFIRAQNTAGLAATVASNDIETSTSTVVAELRVDATLNTPVLCLDASGNILDAGNGRIALTRAAGAFDVEQASAAALATANGIPAANVTVSGAISFGLACAPPPVSSLEAISAPAFSETASAPSDSRTNEETRPAARGFASDRNFPRVLGKLRSGFAYANEALPLGLLMSAAEAPAEDRAVEAPQQQTRQAAVAAPVAAVSGGTVNVHVGTLGAGDSVTITFQVTIDSPWTGPQPQVSNQGTVTADGGVSVSTDDPSEAGAFNPTVTPLLLPPDVSVNDATVAEPASGSADMLFTVSLSHAYSQTVTVNYQTANGGANPATAGTDYTTTNGTATFAPGETVQTVAVPVLTDGDASEGSETFLLNLSSPSNGVIDDAQATGTITDDSVASELIISELRTRGPNGDTDDFVELLNTTDTAITVAASDASSGWSIVKKGADCTDTPVVVGVIPNGTVIPARGNYLLTGSGYSLGSYATGDALLSADIENDGNVGLFKTTEVTGISSVNRLDAVGFGANTTGNCALLREGNTLGAITGYSVDFSFVRKVAKGLTQDTTDDNADFIVVDTNGTSVGGGNPQHLGAPGPEGLASPTGPVPCSNPTGTQLFGRELIDPSVGAATAPNVVRDLASDPGNNSTFGTIDFRRTFTNNTGGNVTRLRFRIIDLSTFPAAPNTADLRARTSTAVVVTTGSGNKTVQGTTLEEPPAQLNGGGINASLAAGTITLATPLTSGSSVNLRFLFGVQQTGDYNVGIVLEALPGPTGKDFWKVSGHTENGGHTDGGCNRAPVAEAGNDQNPECSGGQASVTLDAVGSTDPDGDTPLTYEWKEGATLLGTTQSITASFAVGSHTVTLKVTDPSGDSSTDTVTVNVVDTTAPQVTAPPDITVYTGPGASSCGTAVGDAQLGNGSATDGCQGALPVNRTGVPAGNFFPVGPTQITYSATDAAGNTGTAVQTVTVIDNTPPVVTPPADKTVPADPDSCSATVNPGTATATDNCTVQTIAGTRSDSQPLNAPYPVGTTTITWKATDASGNHGTATQTINVVDTQAPSVTSSVAVTTMGPPFNHALINVGLAATAFDNCFGLGPLQVFVYSDEDDGPAPHSPDAANVGLGSLRLRRERDGGSNGRVYLVVVKATDGSGNTSASCSTVTVPLSNSAADQSSVNAQAASAASFCSANNGAAPGGFFAVGP